MHFRRLPKFWSTTIADFRYPKEHLQTPPQWRVKVRPIGYSETPIKPKKGNPKSNVQWFDTQDTP